MEFGMFYTQVGTRNYMELMTVGTRYVYTVTQSSVSLVFFRFVVKSKEALPAKSPALFWKGVLLGNNVRRLVARAVMGQKENAKKGSVRMKSTHDGLRPCCVARPFLLKSAGPVPDMCHDAHGRALVGGGRDQASLNAPAEVVPVEVEEVAAEEPVEPVRRAVGTFASQPMH